MRDATRPLPFGVGARAVFDLSLDGKLLTIGTPDEVRNNVDVQHAYLGVAA